MKNADDRKLVSIVVSALNEAEIIAANLNEICAYMARLADRYDWELIVVDDGSSDETWHVARKFAADYENVIVLRHPHNFGLGQAMQFAFANTSGDIVITLDVDLSYSTKHIGRLIAAMEESSAKLVIASPYMDGGELVQVPRVRKFFSVCANFFLSLVAQSRLSTLTGMVRAYDGLFIRNLNFRSQGMDVMPEIVYKAMILRAKIVEIPAVLDWSKQNVGGQRRVSSMRVASQIIQTLMSGYLFRPFAFFLLPGFLMLVFSIFVNYWMFVHFFDAYASLASMGSASFSAAVSMAYETSPHTFIVGLLSLMLAIQLITLGVISQQNKRYFDEIFHFLSRIHRTQKND